jgi:uncharacterized protein (DUF2252 family)
MVVCWKFGTQRTSRPEVISPNELRSSFGKAAVHVGANCAVRPEGSVDPSSAARLSPVEVTRMNDTSSSVFPPGQPPRLTPAQRAEVGIAARRHTPLELHADAALASRRDPVAILETQARSRVPELVPVRYGRMLVSPFTYLRGAAAMMAADLAVAPTSGLITQLCGDAHLLNFGLFASPERQLVFDVNDFDETYPGPFEWDIKRLATSLVTAARENGHPLKDQRKVVFDAVERYRSAMNEFALQGELAAWYVQANMEQAQTLFAGRLDKRQRKDVTAALAKARKRTSLQAMGNLTAVIDGRRQILDVPHVIQPVRTLLPMVDDLLLQSEMRTLLARYVQSLPSNLRVLLARFEIVDMARKVVGVGSVGTRCYIVLLRGRDEEDWLILQVKEAQTSVLADHRPTPTSLPVFDNQGERVVAGQRLMQASSDIFLGWESVQGTDGQTRDYYVRQLRDWKGSAAIETMSADDLRHYGALCGWTLARAHARAGDRIAIAAYLGDTNVFAHAVTDFADSYAAQTELDHAALRTAAIEGRITVVAGI